MKIYIKAAELTFPLGFPYSFCLQYRSLKSLQPSCYYEARSMVEKMMEETWCLDSLVDFYTSPGLPIPELLGV